MRYMIVFLLLAAALVGAWWFGQQRQTGPDEPVVEFVTAPAPRPEPRYPLPEPEPEPEPLTLLAPEAAEQDEDTLSAEPAPDTVEPALAPLPVLSHSDPAVLDDLRALLGSEAVERWVRPDWIISRAVVIVHSLDGDAPPVEIRPLGLLRGAPRTTSEGEGRLFWTETTARRYAEVVGLLQSVSPTESAARYARYYPLFQQAWEELGEPEPWFNDRLIDVIDHLLAAPPLELPLELTPWEGRLKLADDRLEAESWGRKLLIRLGPDQATAVQAWLQALRQELVGRGGPQSG